MDPVASDAEGITVISLAEGLARDGEDIWCTRGTEAVSYAAGSHDTCFTLEEGSFWFAHRNLCLQALLRRVPPGGTLFDIGGGNGFVAQALRQDGHQVVLVEPGSAGVQHARARGIPLIIRGTLREANFKSGTLPAASLFDVLEHVGADADFLSEVHRCVKPRGRVYLTVPVCPWLWSDDDVKAGHFRRYQISGLMQLLRSTGFTPLFASYFFAFLPLPLFLFRSLSSFFGRRTLRPQSYADLHKPREASLLRFLLKWEEARIRAGRTIPCGTSCLVAAEKI